MIKSYFGMMTNAFIYGIIKVRTVRKEVISLNKTAVINPQIYDKFQSFTESGRVIFFEAPCGFGKTTVAKALLKNMHKRVREVQADEANFEEIAKEKAWDVLFCEDMQQLQSDDDYHALCSLIRNNPDKRFVLTSRGTISGELIPFRISGLLIEVNEDELFFTRQLAAEYFEKRGISLSETALNSAMKKTLGYPLALEMVAERMADGAPYNQKMNEDILHSLYVYYDEMIFRRFSLTIRRFLMELAPFDEFDTELAKMVSGDADAGKIITYLERYSRMIKTNGADNYYFWPIFRRFLMWEQDRSYTPQQQRAVCSRGGLYYELHKNYAKALEFYSKSGEQDKISELIIKIMELHPGMGHYEELESYYLSLPDETIAKSPALMQGKCMLCSLCGDYDGAEKWYDALKSFTLTHDKSDAAVKEAKGRLAWLDISLPHRSISGLTDTISAIFRLISTKAIKLMPFSVTSALPSIMNGGKDFSQWSKKDDLLYKTMKAPVEAVLGRDGIGLAECSVAESKFEKGEDISGRILSLLPKLNEIQTKGTPDIEFALVGLLVRSQTASGRAEDAQRTLLNLRERFVQNGYDRFLPNIDAMQCRIALRRGDMDYADEWYRDSAPRDLLKLRVMRRYRYLTQAMTELAQGNEEAALLTLSPLENYFESCRRHIDMINLKVLKAIAQSRLENDEWKKNISEAVETASEYGFVRTISMYGAAVLPLLDCSDKSDKFLNAVLKASRVQAVYYPNFLKPESSFFEKLTEAELQVLRLLCADKSNSEIGEILDIRLATVKSHVSHILQKLGVSRRSEAKTTAQKLRII